ncbi:AMP-binding protein [Streptomyces sp. NBC_01343]|uniref:AMP-binding protein n=1 Tax=Streptomyces sp. NBC_01343 TaxID=2903832 RepID=UPI002E1114FA|nr:AMP-binding protein [Streptomyces sp. NBC_01343]
MALFLLSDAATGAPLLVPRTHDDYAYQARAAADLVSLTENDVYLAALPAESNLAFGCPGIVGTLSAGGTVVLVENPDLVDDCLAAVERERATITSVTPDAARHWTDALPTARADLSSLRLLQVGGGAPLPRAGAERIGPAWGGRLQQVFAMAEGCSRSPGPPIRTKPCAPRRSARSHPTTRSASSTRTAGTYPTGSPANSSPAARTPPGLLPGARPQRTLLHRRRLLPHRRTRAADPGGRPGHDRPPPGGAEAVGGLHPAGAGPPAARLAPTGTAAGSGSSRLRRAAGRWRGTC